jgi:hypothetical protein
LRSREAILESFRDSHRTSQLGRTSQPTHRVTTSIERVYDCKRSGPDQIVYTIKLADPGALVHIVSSSVSPDHWEQLIDFPESLVPSKEAVHTCGIEVWVSANASDGDQIRCFYNGSMFIIMHGSQLSHMVWMKVDDVEHAMSVIEILPYM